MGPWRLRYASDAAEGMWAHITLIYPFRDSARLDAETIQGIENVVFFFESFPFSLARVEYFRSPRVVLYLAPEPAAPFRALTGAFEETFPDAPSYGGMFEEVIPHVQIADEDDSALLGTIESDIGPRLPIEATARKVELVEHTSQGWSRRQVFTLPGSA